jgi:hypothetical protein
MTGMDSQKIFSGMKEERDTERQSGPYSSVITNGRSRNIWEGGVWQGGESQGGKTEEDLISRKLIGLLGSRLGMSQTSIPFKKKCVPERQSDHIPLTKIKEEINVLGQVVRDSERQSSSSFGIKVEASGDPNEEKQGREEEIEEEWQIQILQKKTQPDHDWRAQVAKCLLKDFPQSVQDLFQESNRVEEPSYGSNSSEPVPEPISQELNRLVEPESQKEGNLTNWRTDNSEMDYAEWEEVDASRKDSWSTKRDNVWDSTD